MSYTPSQGEPGSENTAPYTNPGQASPQSGGNTGAPTDVYPGFAIPLAEAENRSRQLQQFVREQLVDGEDYGIIPGTNKPTLFKSGAEKLNAIFGFAPQAEVTNRVEDWTRGFVSYEVKVSLLNKRTGVVEAEGLGICNSKERRYAKQDAAAVANTVLKMARKRALVDATLSATQASGHFTQDSEDSDDILARPSTQRTEATAQAENSSPETRPTNYTATTAAGPNLLTDAQHRAILAIANRVFGRPATADDFSQLTDKPLEDLTKAEASALIDRLRYQLPDTARQQDSQKRATQR
jgi:hypothetical protein